VEPDVLIYMNKDWKGEYECHLELWNAKRNLLVNVLFFLIFAFFPSSSNGQKHKYEKT